MHGKALHKISYGLYVVTSRLQDRLNGQVANAVMQTTADPPMVALCLNKQNLTHEFVTESRVAAISVLSEDTPMPFIGRFGFKSGRDLDKLEGVQYQTGLTGAPVVLDHVVAYLELEIGDQLDAVTHTMFIGRVVAAEIVDEALQPMTYAYYHEVKRGRSPKTAPTYIKETRDSSPGSGASQMSSEADKWVCTVCGYVYDPALGDPEHGIPPGTRFEQLPESWVCPECGATKDQFEPLAS
jgi:flavin reductase (DIM6/NTAB) family NADH-FMN oxidoreductase RutF/rubredoxin